MKPKVRITAYKDHLVIETEAPHDKTDNFVPDGDGRIGCVLIGTQELLGVSDEALALLQKVKKGRDAIGDLMWWEADGGRCCFGWLGGPLCIKDMSDIVGDRDYAVRPGHYVTIPNDVPDGAKGIIDE